jgi:aminoglycoside phosphotransferase (APT) family kinase protein
MTPLLAHADAQAILHQAFPSTTETITHITSLHSTFFNTNFLLTVSSGTKYILKVSPSPTAVRVLHNDIAILSVEAALLPRLSSTLLLPTPKLHLYDDSLRILPAPFVLLSHLRGTAGSSSLIVVEKTHRRLSSLLSPPKWFGRITSAPTTTFSSWRQCFGALMEAALRDGEDMALLLPYSMIRGSLCRLGGALDAITAPQLVVVDFGPESVLTAEDGSHGTTVTGVIGFERALWGDPRLASFHRDLDHDHEGEMGTRDLL